MALSRSLHELEQCTLTDDKKRWIGEKRNLLTAQATKALTKQLASVGQLCLGLASLKDNLKEDGLPVEQVLHI